MGTQQTRLNVVLEPSIYETLYPRTVPKTAGPKKTATLIDLIHKHHALIFEHHGLYHQLGYGHSGATNPLFAPALAGDGAGRHVADRYRVGR